LGGKPPKGNQISSLSFTALKTPSFKGGVLRSYAQRLPKHNTSFKFSLPAAQERQNLEKKYYPPFNLFCMSKNRTLAKPVTRKLCGWGSVFSQANKSVLKYQAGIPSSQSRCRIFP
jgi:hypothetical protein